MAWKGFLKESKFYMGYPGWRREPLNYHEGTYNPYETELYRPRMSDDAWDALAPARRRKKIEFWRAFPKAAVKFYYFTFCDWCRKSLMGHSGPMPKGTK